MKQSKKWMLFLIVSATCALWGCDSDVIQSKVDDQSKVDEEEQEQDHTDKCHQYGTCDEPEAGDNQNDCLEACEIGEKRCDNNDVVVCAKQKSGCPKWVVDTVCVPGTHCDDSTLRCETGCMELCEGQPKRKCTQGGVAECKTDSAGCAVWETIEPCEAGRVCDSEALECVDGCAERCDPDALIKCTPEGLDHCESDENGCAVHDIDKCDPGTYCDDETLSCMPCQETCKPDALKRCSDFGVESCTADANGCAVWTQTETCGENQTCDASSLECMDGCVSSCEEGEKKCENNGIAECRDTNGDGCFEWDAPVECAGGQTCDDSSKSCVCNNACRDGEKKCENNSVSTCVKTDSGCLAWSKAEPCGTGKSCNAAKNACEYTCGNDCAPFSIILIPDTQNYARDSAGENNLYTKQMKWIKDNEKKENIRAAIHLGDITDNNTTAQWQVADYAHKNYIDKSNVPYSMATGNHDYKGSGGYGRGRTKIGEYFGEKRFKGKSWYHSTPYVGNSYITFSVGNIKFLVLGLEFAARKDVVCWADELIKKYPDHHVIVETHNYLTHNSSTVDSKYSGGAYLPDAMHGSSGWDLYHELVARHSNVFMAVGGHVGDTEWRQKTAFNKNVVTEMLVDYQFDAPCTASSASKCTDHCKHVKNAGNGWMRQLIFDPKTNKVQAKTLTVLGNKGFAGGSPAFYCSSLNSKKDNQCYNKDPKHSDHQFSFTSDFTTPITYKYNNNNYLGFGIRNINNNGDGQQLNPAIAMHRTTGSFVAVWEDDSSGDDGKGTAGSKKGVNNHDIMARIFYGGGCQKVAQFAVNADKAGDQKTPAVAMDKDGNFVVVWSDDKDGNGYYEIFMRGFDEKGKERIKTTVVNSKADGQQLNPSIAMAPNGRFVVAWEDESNGASTPQIYIRGFDANGKQTFADRNVDNLEGVRRKPDVGIADDGSFVVTWEDDSDMNKMFQVQAKGFKADGTDRIKRFTVNSVADGQQLNPSISMNGAGVFYIAYEDDADGNGIYRIKARGYQADGKQLVADMHISDAGENAVQPALCVDKNNNVIYSWTARAREKGDVRRRVYKNKALAESTGNANSIVSGVQDQPAVACTENGKYAILWHDDLDENDYYEIFGHGYNGM
ncbi:MAG: metallophosphoesterase [Proteobacteria bacterium]|nr:metallophosphoesterase [Pseudomonadota bacterium]